MKSEAVNSYVDVGCWYGLLMDKVAKKSGCTSLWGIDGVKYFLEVAENLEFAGAATYLNRTMRPQSWPVSSLSYKITPEDTSKSGLLASDGLEVELAPTMTIRELVNYLGEDVFRRAYLKVDTEECEPELIADLCELKIAPAVLHVEVLQRTADSIFSQKERLLELGFRLPKLQYGHRFWSLAMSERRSVCIGFEPMAVYER